MAKKKLLLVEDNVFLSEVYSDMLHAFEIDVTVAHTGNEGYEKARQGGWDLILMDIVLPDMDGFQIVKKASESMSNRPGKSILFLTSLDNENEIKMANELGDGLIQKSDMTPGDLIQKISPYLNL